MAASSIPRTHLFSRKILFSVSSLRLSKSFVSHPTTPAFLFRSISSSSAPIRFTSRFVSNTSLSPTTTFTWDDAEKVSQPEYLPNDSSDLSGFFEKIQFCNRGSELQSEFIPFVMEDQVIGYVHNRFVEQLRRFKDVFIFPQNNTFRGQFKSYISLNERLKSPEDRTRAVGLVIKCLGEEGLIPGIRNELYPVVSSFHSPVYFSLERAAAPYFGIKAYGIHMNGFVERDDEKYLWIGKRSQVKSTFPGMLDHLVAGGLPHGISCGDNVIKECEEEAGIPQSISHKAKPVGVVSYMDIEGYRFKRDVLFCYDLKLPESFIPENQDGEVESFKLIPVENVGNIIRRTHFFKPNCSLVIIHFLFRHGYINPECLGYLDLLQSLSSGDCS